MRLWCVVDDISTHTSSSPKTVTLGTHTVAQLVSQGLSKLSRSQQSSQRCCSMGPTASCVGQCRSWESCTLSSSWAGAHGQSGSWSSTKARRSTYSGWRQRRWQGVRTKQTSTFLASHQAPLRSRELRQDEKGWHRHLIVRLVAQGIWTQQRVAKRFNLEDAACQLCNKQKHAVPQVLRVPSAAGRQGGTYFATNLLEDPKDQLVHVILPCDVRFYGSGRFAELTGRQWQRPQILRSTHHASRAASLRHNFRSATHRGARPRTNTNKVLSSASSSPDHAPNSARHFLITPLSTSSKPCSSTDAGKGMHL